MAIGDDLLNAPTGLPVLPEAPPALPPSMLTPEQLVAQLQGYRNAFNGMGNDAAFNPTMMRLGLGLLQPIRPGDTAGGVISKAGTDAMNYYDARSAHERNQLMSGYDMALRTQESQGRQAASAESAAASRQGRQVTAASAPLQIGQLQQAYQKAKSDLELIQREEASGTRSPDFLRRKGVAEVALREAQARLYDSHAQYYKTVGNAAGDKNRKQTVNVRAIENADGTQSILSTVVVNGEPYFHTFTPPRYADLRTATEAATKEVDKETPSSWNPFAGPAPYQGTREEEIARRAKGYMTPSLNIMGPKGPVSSKDWDSFGAPTPETPQTPQATPNAAPAAPGGDPKMIPQGPYQMPPARRPSGSPTTFPVETQEEAVGATERSLGIIRGELRDARQRNAPTQEITALEREEKRAAERLKGGAPGHNTKDTSRTTFTRDASGQIVPPRPAGAPQPQGQPQVSPTDPVEIVGQRVEMLRTELAKARSVAQRYGLKQQREDSAGYRAALSRIRELQEQLGVAHGEYEKVVGAAGRPATSATPGFAPNIGGGLGR